MGGTLHDHLRDFGVDPRGMTMAEAYKELDRQSRLALKMQEAGNLKFMEALKKTDMGGDLGSTIRGNVITGNRINPLHSGSPFFKSPSPQPVPEALRWLRGQVEEICSLGRSVGV